MSKEYKDLVSRIQGAASNVSQGQTESVLDFYDAKGEFVRNFNRFGEYETISLGILFFVAGDYISEHAYHEIIRPLSESEGQDERKV